MTILTSSSHVRRMVLLFAAVAMLVSATWPAHAQAKRAALIIGNGAYDARQLPNPPNDATDMAAALKEAGFDVILRTDIDLKGMESALTDFRAVLRGKDTALFYYAGHGVQVDGENYLIPVHEQIENETQARQRGVAVSDVIYRIKDAGVPTALVFLDACRDNPFPGSTRSATRGLTVEPPAEDIETLIAYATEPGGVSADGSGRNGVFTGALLANMRQAGLGISEMMIKVRADVMSQTKGKQKPRTDVGLSRPFYFYDPIASAARAQQDLKETQDELAAIEQEVAQREAAIAATKDAAKRQDLEVQQQREKALAAAKKLEADNLSAEAERRQKTAAMAQQAALQRQSADLATREQQKALTELAAARRAELDNLSQTGSRDDPDVLIQTIERLDSILTEIDAKYAAALEKGTIAANATWDKQLAALAKESPDKTETDDDFAARIAGGKKDIEGRRQADLSQVKSTSDAQREVQTAGMRKQRAAAVVELEVKTWTIRGSAVSVKAGAFDRNARTWPFTVESRDRAVPILPVEFVAELGKTVDPKQAIRDLDSAVTANAIAGEIDWGLTRDPETRLYAVVLKGVRVVNLTSGNTVVETGGNQRVAVFSAGSRKSPTPTCATLTIAAGLFDGQTSLTIIGSGYGGLIHATAPFSRRLYPGSYSVRADWPDLSSRNVDVTLADGETRQLTLTKPFTTETRNFFQWTMMMGSGRSNAWDDFGVGLKWIGELSGYTHLFNPLYAQADVNATTSLDASSDSSLAVEASAAVGAWLFGRADTRPTANAFGCGTSTADGGLGFGVGAGAGVGAYGFFGKLIGDLVIAFPDAVSFEVEIQGIIPLQSSQPWEVRVEIPIVGGGEETGEREEH